MLKLGDHFRRPGLGHGAGGPLADDGVRTVLQRQGNPGGGLDFAAFYTLRFDADVESGLMPDEPDRGEVRPAVGADTGKPDIARFLQACDDFGAGFGDHWLTPV